MVHIDGSISGISTRGSGSMCGWNRMTITASRSPT